MNTKHKIKYIILLHDVTCEQQKEYDSHLVDGVSEDVLHHGARDEGLGASVRLPQQQLVGGHLRGEGERGEGVHDQVHPQHLDGLERGILHPANHCLT